MQPILKASACLVLLAMSIGGPGYSAQAAIEINNVLSVGMRVPLEVFFQFNVSQILVPEVGIGAIGDTTFDIDSYFGGIILSVGAKLYLARADFSGLFVNGFASGGAVFTLGRSKATSLVLTIPHLDGGIDMTFRAFPFFSLTAEGRWNFTIPSVSWSVGGIVHF